MTRGLISVAEHSPELIPEWNEDRNEGLNPRDVSYGSGLPVWWVCTQGHEWTAPPNRRTANNSGCPVCMNRTVLPGFNDLATTHPDLAAEWSQTRNDSLSPQVIGKSYSGSVWWVCSVGHEWDAPVKRRTSMKTGCSVCTGRRVQVGVNDLQSVRPDVAAQWSPQNKTRPIEYTKSSKFKARWVCTSGHRWAASIKDRTRPDGKHTGCPTCARHVSRQEQELADYITSLGFEALRNDRKIIQPKELDIVIPELKVAFEYNGKYWHSEEKRPLNHRDEKTRLAEQAGYKLIHVEEDDWTSRRSEMERMIRDELTQERAPWQ